VTSTAAYTSELAASLAEDALERFCRYVRIATTSDHRGAGKDSPSTPGQWDLARLLADELRALGGIEDVVLDDHCYVTATLPGNVEGAPVIGVIAHVDTSEDAPGDGVEPIVHRNYDGGVIELPRGGTVLDPAAMPELSRKVGHDLVTSSGDTLLGADDKAGVAAIMTALKRLVADPSLPRCTLRIAFTPDEEIGSLASGLDLETFGARCAYTIDGSEIGELAYESFSAKEATVTIEGHEVHPGYAYGKLVSAVRLAADVIAALPREELTPDTTKDRDGYIHVLTIEGNVARATFRAILRDFDDELLSEHEELLRQTVASVVDAEPRARATVDIIRQYHNMRTYIEPDPAVIEVAQDAYRAEGIEPESLPIRGGTDGSALSLRGLPTPNIFDGGYEFHSVREWASLQELAASAAVIVRLAEAWSER
jgi:tripeptide aminopeptidase